MAEHTDTYEELLAEIARLVAETTRLQGRVTELESAIIGKDAEIMALREPAPRVLRKDAGDAFDRPFTGYRHR